MTATLQRPTQALTPLWWDEAAQTGEQSPTVVLWDQRLLPAQEVTVRIRTVAAMANAITTMIVRGAPAIGIAAAYGLVLSAYEHLVSNTSPTKGDFWQAFTADAATLRATRPTAVNLMWAVDRMLAFTQAQTNHLNGWDSANKQSLFEAITAEANAIHTEDIAACKAMGAHGAALLQQHLPKGATILTHCNAGALATGGYGTALGVIRSLFAADPTLKVVASETRPRLQGAKLTAWELYRDGIPVTLVSDNMVASLMRQGGIDAVLVGADRIARNGDTANKIGTYSHALSAYVHNIPFYVVAPLSTIDPELPDGSTIEIEERCSNEITDPYGDYPVPVRFWNPGFDVTPAQYISQIITEKGTTRVSIPDPFGLWLDT
ncbi:MAG: S-methyl-5-thioribose-1-phosphate isomerase [Vampirovibrionales bacterium]|nr:S-methyl-5-thioribose-1-phosphate isomerase [Vampirovibrionales bacterium]